jgi:hypothetical protein
MVFCMGMNIQVRILGRAAAFAAIEYQQKPGTWESQPEYGVAVQTAIGLSESF